MQKKEIKSPPPCIKGKEKFKDRLRQLIGKRSIRAAAKAWELPYSTLNNYFDKNTTPNLFIAQKISEIEKVSLEWLATGEEYSLSNTMQIANSHAKAWLDLLEVLTEESQKQILDILKMEGIKLLLELKKPINIELMQLSDEKKSEILLKNKSNV